MLLVLLCVYVTKGCLFCVYAESTIHIDYVYRWYTPFVNLQVFSLLKKYLILMAFKVII